LVAVSYQSEVDFSGGLVAAVKARNRVQGTDISGQVLVGFPPFRQKGAERMGHGGSCELGRREKALLDQRSEKGHYG
jgi:hypothetical protein